MSRTSGAKPFGLIVTITLLGLVSACIGMDPSSVADLEPRGDVFQAALHREYATLATKESKLYDWSDAAHFAHKAEAAAAGRDVPPEMPEIWGITAPELEELEAARQSLIDLTESSARSRTPNQLAQAQAALDCWIEEQQEGHQPDMIAACKQRWEMAMATAQLASQPTIEPAAAPEGDTEVPAIEMPEDYRLYFALDSSEIDPEARQILDQFVGNALLLQPERIVVAGHADRSGPEIYNQGLSVRRARSVAALLINAGFPAERLDVQAYGETAPAVPTPDGVAKHENRRVVVEMR